MARNLWTEERKDETVRLYEQGYSMRAVAILVGSSVRHVHRVLNERFVVRDKKEMYSGAGNPAWKGGRRRDKDGYVLVFSPDHPGADAKRYVREHRLVMEQHLDRYLEAKEVVHHKNGKKDDNRIENLELFPTNGDHLRHELKGRIPNWSKEGKARMGRRPAKDKKSKAQ